jgi:hypothetical protein
LSGSSLLKGRTASSIGKSMRANMLTAMHESGSMSAWKVPACWDALMAMRKAIVRHTYQIVAAELH